MGASPAKGNPYFLAALPFPDGHYQILMVPQKVRIPTVSKNVRDQGVQILRNEA